jgi:hypothetical protein
MIKPTHYPVAGLLSGLAAGYSVFLLINRYVHYMPLPLEKIVSGWNLFSGSGLGGLSLTDLTAITFVPVVLGVVMGAATGSMLHSARKESFVFVGLETIFGGLIGGAISLVGLYWGNEGIINFLIIPLLATFGFFAGSIVRTKIAFRKSKSWIETEISSLELIPDYGIDLCRLKEHMRKGDYKRLMRDFSGLTIKVDREIRKNDRTTSELIRRSTKQAFGDNDIIWLSALSECHKDLLGFRSRIKNHQYNTGIFTIGERVRKSRDLLRIATELVVMHIGQSGEERSYEISPNDPNVVEDYYGILQVRPSASIGEIKKAFRNLAKTHHPDKIEMHVTRNEKERIEAKFKCINIAYETLKDRDKRKMYDIRHKKLYGSSNR